MRLLLSCFLGLGAIALGVAQQALLQANTSGSSSPAYSAEIRRQLSIAILSNPDLPLVLEQAKAILQTGLNAGSGYGVPTLSGRVVQDSGDKAFPVPEQR
jgi:hypothetical protein